MKELDGRPDAAKIVLWVISEDDDEYSAYITYMAHPQVSLPTSNDIGENTTLDISNTFVDMCNGSSEYLLYDDLSATDDTATLFIH